MTTKAIILSVLPAVFLSVSAVANDDFVLGILEKNCIQCHGQDGKVKGKVNLLEIKDTSSLLHDPELLKKLVDVIDFEEMPPEDEPQIEPKARKKLLAELQGLLEKSVSGKKESSMAGFCLRKSTRLDSSLLWGSFQSV